MILFFLFFFFFKKKGLPPFFFFFFFFFFFAFLSQVTHYLTAVKIWKKSVDWKIFARTSLSVHDMVFAAFGFILTQFLLEGFVTNTSQVICSDETQLFPG